MKMQTAQREIKRVLGFRIGQEVELDGARCEIKGFPTRKMVVVERLANREVGDWTNAKVLVAEISRV